jgi:hypothetical protein
MNWPKPAASTGGILLATLAFGLLGVALVPMEAVAASVIEFQGAQLGMSQADWRALPPPGQLSPHAKAGCSDDPDPTGVPMTAADRAAGRVVCAYVDTYGKLSLPVRFAFDKSYRLEHLRYAFSGGRLVEIRAEVSLAGYDALTRDFTQRYGAPVRVVRDSVKSEIGPLPRVLETWRTQEGDIELADPILPDDEIGIRFATGPALAPSATKSASR